METNLKITKQNGVPAYKQICLHYMGLITSGLITQTQRLPVERELAKTLNVSRGTVKKAYEFLILNGYAIAVQGSGTFVSYKNQNLQENTCERQKIDALIDHLTQSGLDYNEISSLLHVHLSCKQKYGKINIAAVDCNRETLSIIKNQLSYMENINFVGFLLSDVLSYSNPEAIFGDFHFILTTTMHFNDLNNFINKFESKIVKTVVSTDKSTIFKIANVATIEKMCVITNSERFSKIINYNLRNFGLDIKDENFITTKGLSKEKLSQFLIDKQTVIIPPFYAMDFSGSIGEELFNFNKENREIITFNYIIERGSLIYIEEKITDALTNIKHLI